MYGRYLGNTCTHDLTIHSTWRAQIYDFLVYFSYTVWTPFSTSSELGKRCRAPRVGLGGAPTRASYYTYTHEPTTSPVTVDVLVEAAGAVLGHPGSINLPAPKKRSMS